MTLLHICLYVQVYEVCFFFIRFRPKMRFEYNEEEQKDQKADENYDEEKDE